jgi:hypothetical protein
MYCVHGTCHVPVSLPKDLKGARQLPTSFQGICLQCIETNQLEIRMKANVARRNIFGGKAMVPPRIERALQKDFPPIQIIEVEVKQGSKEPSKRISHQSKSSK